MNVLKSIVSILSIFSIETTPIPNAEYISWSVEYNKTLDYEGLLSWWDNKQFIEQHNLLNDEFKLKLNKFADIHHLQWGKTKYHNLHRNFTLPIEKAPLLGTPKSIDWRKRHAVTPIKDQQQCGSCWAFSAVGSMEGQHAIKDKKLVSLSESQIVDCDVNGTDQGCGGGWMDGAFEYVIKQGGLESEEEYPYTPQNEPCKFNKRNVVAKFTSFKDVTGGETGLKEAVASIGPIAVAIDASGPMFQFYSKGVYYDPKCSSSLLDHGVLVVGYGTEDDKDYWIVKNSWGRSWGDNGYIYMARNKNNNCGIATKPSYPI